MSAKRIIIGDSEISVPDKLLSMGVFPIIVITIVIWLLLGLYSVGPDEVGVVQRFGKYDCV
jgi:membrane protease subunit HflK